jgi:solute carrier family 35 protein E1
MRQTSESVRLAAIVCGWFACSVATAVFDKHIMTKLGAPLSLALWKFVVSAPCGLVAVSAFNQQPTTVLRTITTRAHIVRVVPLGAMIVGAKLFTYISYGNVPLSTAQIVKAATPVVTVFMTRSVLGERFGLQSYLSLLPIACGVCLAVGLDVDFNMLGVLAALTSCIFAAGQSVYMKTLLIAPRDQALALDALSLNLLSATACASLLLPVWLGVQLGFMPPSFDGGQRLWQRRHGARIWTSLIIGALTQYGQSVCAYLLLERVSPATAVVVGTARKPFIVIFAVCFFGKHKSVLNFLGVGLAFAGVFWYNYARYAERRPASKGARAQPIAVDEEPEMRGLTNGGDGSDHSEEMLAPAPSHSRPHAPSHKS